MDSEHTHPTAKRILRAADALVTSLEEMVEGKYLTVYRYADSYVVTLDTHCTEAMRAAGATSERWYKRKDGGKQRRWALEDPSNYTTVECFEVTDA